MQITPSWEWQEVQRLICVGERRLQEQEAINKQDFNFKLVKQVVCKGRWMIVRMIVSQLGTKVIEINKLNIKDKLD